MKNDAVDYLKTVEWMFGRLPMYQLHGKKSLHYKLDHIKDFCKVLGNPQLQFKSIHVAGTNGKGSSSHMLASILQTSGYKTGLYTSPHLVDFRERIKVNGHCISETNVVEFVQKHRDYITSHNLSFFECVVAMSFDYFARVKVDIAIIEVGLGGRLDSTNIITPEVSLITNISMDHTDILGDTLQKIAYEKSGVIKPRVPVVLSEYQKDTFDIFYSVAHRLKSSLTVASNLQGKNYPCELLGKCQSKNIKGVIATLRHLEGFSFSEIDIEQGLAQITANTGLKGRWQQIRKTPKVVLDIAHNVAGFQEILEQIDLENASCCHFVLGFVKDKNIDSILELLPKKSQYYFCEPNIPRALSVSILKKKAKSCLLNGKSYKSVYEAYKSAVFKASNTDFLYVGGSTFVVADYLKQTKTSEDSSIISN